MAEGSGEDEGSGGRLMEGLMDGRVGGTTSLEELLLHADTSRRVPRATLI